MQTSLFLNIIIYVNTNTFFFETHLYISLKIRYKTELRIFCFLIAVLPLLANNFVKQISFNHPKFLSSFNQYSDFSVSFISLFLYLFILHSNNKIRVVNSLQRLWRSFLYPSIITNSIPFIVDELL